MKSRRTGFTLIELLVALTVTGILLAVLLPAVQQAREASRRAQCKSNLKILGLACHTFHDAYGSFPVGFSTGRNQPWGIGILPYLDEAALFQSLTNGTISPSHPGLSTKLEVFLCPTAPGIEAAGVSNYVGSWGAGSADSPDIQTNSAGDGGGVFVQDSAVRIRDIRDGTTNTLLIGEALPLARGKREHVPQDVYEWGGQSISEVCGDMRLPINSSTPVSFEVNNFSSCHAGGSQFCFADGAVRFVSEHINCAQTNLNSTQGLYQNLADRRDERVISDVEAD